MVKDIKGFENAYTISDTGVITSKNRYVQFIDGRRRYYHSQVIRHKINKAGYCVVNLYDELGKLHTYRVHELVAQNFIPYTGLNPDGSKIHGDKTVNHKNGIKTDNRVENLEWCDRKYNTQHEWSTGLVKCTDKMVSGILKHNDDSKIKVAIIKDNSIIGIFDCSIAAAEYLKNIEPNSGKITTIARTIRYICRKERQKKSWHNYTFQYI